jgi:hypothetical protein
MKKNIQILFVTIFFLFPFFSFACQDGEADQEKLLSNLKEWQTLMAVIIVIIGWFVNSRMNRKSEITKKRIENRLTAFKWIIENVYLDIFGGISNLNDEDQFYRNLEKARSTMQLYGYVSEIEIFESYIEAINLPHETEEEINQKLKTLNERTPKLMFIIQSYRKELGLDIYDFDKREKH